MALLTTYAVCLASGLVPLVNAELYLAALSATHVESPLLLALAGTLGQMSSKALVYYAGGGLMRLPFRGGRPLVWPERVHQALRRGPAVVFVSALTGLPPFFVVSGAAGATGIRFPRFVLWGSLGRFLRFSAVCLLPALATAGAPDEARRADLRSRLAGCGGCLSAPSSASPAAPWTSAASPWASSWTGRRTPSSSTRTRTPTSGSC